MIKLSKLLDRFWPSRWRVWYAPDSAGGYLWSCSRCSRRVERQIVGTGVAVDVVDCAETFDAARFRAERHAGKHFGMRAVYEEG